MLSWNWPRMCSTYSGGERNMRPPVRSSMLRPLLLTLLCALLIAQQPTTPPQPATGQQQQPAAAEEFKIPVTVDVVVAPTIVLDKDGYYVNGLRKDHFHLFDNNKEQDIQVD